MAGFRLYSLLFFLEDEDYQFWLEKGDEILDDEEDWPVVQESAWNESDSRWNSLTYKHRHMGFPIHHFINISVTLDKNSRHVIKVRLYMILILLIFRCLEISFFS